MRGVIEGIESEIARRAVHASGSLIPLAYLANLLTWDQVRVLIAAGCGLAIVLEVIRLIVGLDWWIYDHLTREYEQDNLAGYALAVISVTIVVFAVEPTVAVPSILMLTLGDPASGLLGSGDSDVLGNAGRFEVIRKRGPILGIMFGVCTAIALPFVPPVAAVFGGVAAMLADGLKPVIFTYVIDDNLTIPLAAAGAISLGLVVV